MESTLNTEMFAERMTVLVREAGLDADIFYQDGMFLLENPFGARMLGTDQGQALEEINKYLMEELTFHGYRIWIDPNLGLLEKFD